MKRLDSFIVALTLGIVSSMALTPADSISYAYGNQMSLAIMAGQNNLMESEDDFREYIRGLEENLLDTSAPDDSSYIVSYLIGNGAAMEKAYLLRDNQNEKERRQFACIVDGLRKVSNNELDLPADTVAARELIEEYADTSKLDDDTRCRYYTAVGVMEAYDRDLQKDITRAKPGTKCVADRLAFAAGMADALELMTNMPETAYVIGKAVAFSMNMGAIAEMTHDKDSFVAGAKAAFGLGKALMTREESEALIPRMFEQQQQALGTTENDVDFGEFQEFIDSLDVEVQVPYRVSWNVTAATVADDRGKAADIFRKAMSKLPVADAWQPGILMIQAPDNDGAIYSVAQAVIKEHPLPEGYRWFCGIGANNTTTVGITTTANTFTANVDEAMVEFDPSSGLFSVPWSYKGADITKWADFTEANIGRNVAVEINGRFMFAPRINMQITGGRCSVTGLSPSEINRLFENAKAVSD